MCRGETVSTRKCPRNKQPPLPQHMAMAWEPPAMRTGGGFALRRAHPRSRATHDSLPATHDNQHCPPFLVDLLQRAEQFEVKSTPNVGRETSVR